MPEKTFPPHLRSAGRDLLNLIARRRNLFVLLGGVNTKNAKRG
jgi:hypothetical protein